MTYSNLPPPCRGTRIDELWTALGQQARQGTAVVDWTVRGGALHVEVEQFESLACRISRWRSTSFPRDDIGPVEFQQRSVEFVTELSQWVMPLQLLEIDSTTPAFLARTPLDLRRGAGEETGYFELVGSPTEVTLRRYVRRFRQRRTSESFTMTKEMVGDLAIACEEFATS